MAQLNDLLVMGQSALLGPVTLQSDTFIAGDGSISSRTAPGFYFRKSSTSSNSTRYLDINSGEGSSANINLYFSNNRYVNIEASSTAVLWTWSAGITKQFTLSGAKVSASSFYASSDLRLKENFKIFTSQQSILDLPVYKFDFIDGEKNQIGCIAQDLQKICPEIVSEDEKGYLSIQESKIVYLLLEEIKQLKREIRLIKGD